MSGYMPRGYISLKICLANNQQFFSSSSNSFKVHMYKWKRCNSFRNSALAPRLMLLGPPVQLTLLGSLQSVRLTNHVALHSKSLVCRGSSYPLSELRARRSSKHDSSRICREALKTIRIQLETIQSYILEVAQSEVVCINVGLFSPTGSTRIDTLVPLLGVKYLVCLEKN